MMIEHLVQQGYKREALVAVVKDSIETFGEDPRTKPQVAANAAAHWIVGDTLGMGPCTLIRLFKVDGGWGREIRKARSYTFDIRQDPDGFRAYMLQLIAGFGGECLAGYFHPSSSTLEKVQYGDACYAVSECQGGDATAIALAGIDVVSGIIADRQEQFDSLRWALERKRRINRRQLAAMSRPGDRGQILRRWEELTAAQNLEDVLQQAAELRQQWQQLKSFTEDRCAF